MAMPAGTYYIGDLCYVLGKRHMERAAIVFPPGEKFGLDGEHVMSDGVRFAEFGTAHGDGVYLSSTGGGVPVDSGRIGCMLVSDLPRPSEVSSGLVVTFGSPFECRSDGEVIMFGHVSIYTDDANDDSLEMTVNA